MPNYWGRPYKPMRAETSEEQQVSGRLLSHYQEIRLDLYDLEVMVGNDLIMSEKEKKRLDKSIVLMKVGAKHLKKVLRSRGYRQMKPEMASAE